MGVVDYFLSEGGFDLVGGRGVGEGAREQIRGWGMGTASSLTFVGTQFLSKVKI
jgi:hypothetical protein